MKQGVENTRRFLEKTTWPSEKKNHVFFQGLQSSRGGGGGRENGRRGRERA